MTNSEPDALAIAVQPMPGESLIGLIARATRLNVLGSTNVILEGCDLKLLHPGTVGQDIGSKLPLLATQLGCTVEALQPLCHPYLGDPDGPLDVRWGNGALVRHDLRVQRRRVSPATLSNSDYHRADWMNALLPFCPDSLELLVDECSHCGKPLGWRRGWGIGYCDDWHCRKPVVPTPSERLAADLASDYRAFAKLVSPIPAVRNSLLAMLEPALRDLPPAVLVALILQLSATLGPDRFPLHRQTVGKLPSPKLASVVVHGYRLINDWPKRLRSVVAEELERPDFNRAASRQKLLDSVRRLGSRIFRNEFVQTVQAALPEAFEHSGTALAGLVRPVVHGATACRLTGLDTSELASLRAAKLLDHRVVSTGKRVSAQYDAEQVQELARRLRQSVPTSRLEQQLFIPRYAVEQLICLGEIELELHPAVLHLKDHLRLTLSSVERLIGDLSNIALTGSVPADAMKLSTAMKVIGGREKPWGAVLNAVRKGDLPVWSDGGAKFTRSAFIRPGDLKPFLNVDFDQARWPSFPFSTLMSQIDANDVLNLDALQIRRVTAAGDLAFEPQGVALVTERAKVTDLARKTIATAEIAMRLGMKFPGVPRRMERHPSLHRSAAGWDRTEFDRIFAGR